MLPELNSLPPDLASAFDKMMELPPEQRLVLSDLLASGVPSSLSEEWDREIERRVESINNGTAVTIPAEKVFEELRGRLRAKS